MTAKSFSILAAVIFTIIALLQLTRALAGWEITDGHDGGAGVAQLDCGCCRHHAGVARIYCA